MSAVDELIAAYKQVVSLPWERSLAGPQKVWFVVYDPPQERRIRLHLDEFAVATSVAGHRWVALDISDSFSRWMAAHEYREAYFEEPDDLQFALDSYGDWLATQVVGTLTQPTVDDNTVVAIAGTGALFGVAHVSRLVHAVEHSIRGRLAVFFPGQYTGSTYRLLDARDGWNYLALAITATNGS